MITMMTFKKTDPLRNPSLSSTTTEEATYTILNTQLFLVPVFMFALQPSLESTWTSLNRIFHAEQDHHSLPHEDEVLEL